MHKIFHNCSDIKVMNVRWVPVSSTGKVSYRRIRSLGSNPAYTKNQLVSWLDDKEQSSWSGRHRFNFYHFYQKKKRPRWVMFCLFLFEWNIYLANNKCQEPCLYFNDQNLLISTIDIFKIHIPKKYNNK